jgi:flagellar protein FlaG
MIETISGNDNLAVKGDQVSSPRPPSSQEVKSSGEVNQSAVQLDLQAELTGETNKNEERIAASQRGGDQSLEEELQKTIEALNEKLTRLNREVLFKIDKRINKNYISVIDKQSKEVIREFPPKDIRTFIARFDEFNEMLNTNPDVKSMIVNLEV